MRKTFLTAKTSKTAVRDNDFERSRTYETMGLAVEPSSTTRLSALTYCVNGDVTAIGIGSFLT